jgi:hypothetical protein
VHATIKIFTAFAIPCRNQGIPKMVNMFAPACRKHVREVQAVEMVSTVEREQLKVCPVY